MLLSLCHQRRKIENLSFKWNFDCPFVFFFNVELLATTLYNSRIKLFIKVCLCRNLWLGNLGLGLSFLFCLRFTQRRYLRHILCPGYWQARLWLKFVACNFLLFNFRLLLCHHVFLFACLFIVNLNSSLHELPVLFSFERFTRVYQLEVVFDLLLPLTPFCVVLLS